MSGGEFIMLKFLREHSKSVDEMVVRNRAKMRRETSSISDEEAQHILNEAQRHLARPQILDMLWKIDDII